VAVRRPFVHYLRVHVCTLDSICRLGVFSWSDLGRCAAKRRERISL